MIVKYRIYMDVCCLNRPLDDSQQDRIRLETEAILSIYRKCRVGEWLLISSEVIDLEIAKTPNIKRLEQLKLAISIAKEKIILANEIKQRVIELTEIGFKSFDAAHVASAEFGGVDVFLTTDDRLLKRSIKYSDQLRVKVSNPVQWFIDVSKTQGD
ncbi:type II toxin-antitoxin system VapC family toxin [Pseudanabaena sp. UWO311]|nr:type II toxin-antitoxin system VapC family toxin [Pseudanabaena sp. UWO311]